MAAFAVSRGTLYAWQWQAAPMYNSSKYLILHCKMQGHPCDGACRKKRPSAFHEREHAISAARRNRQKEENYR